MHHVTFYLDNLVYGRRYSTSMGSHVVEVMVLTKLFYKATWSHPYILLTNQPRDSGSPDPPHNIGCDTWETRMKGGRVTTLQGQCCGLVSGPERSHVTCFNLLSQQSKQKSNICLVTDIFPHPPSHPRHGSCNSSKTRFSQSFSPELKIRAQVDYSFGDYVSRFWLVSLCSSRDAHNSPHFHVTFPILLDFPTPY